MKAQIFGLECPSTVFQRCGKIASIQMKKLAWRDSERSFPGPAQSISRSSIRRDRDRRDPGKASREKRCCRDFRDRPTHSSEAIEPPRRVALWRSNNGDPIHSITDRKIWIDLDRLAIPRQALVKPTHPGVIDDRRFRRMIGERGSNSAAFLISSSASSRRPNGPPSRSAYQWYAVT